MKLPCFTILWFSLYFYVLFLNSLGFHLVYFLMVITDFLIQIEHLWVVLIWKFKKRWWVITLVCSIFPCVFKFWVQHGGLVYEMLFTIWYIVEVVTVSTISALYRIAYPSWMVIWDFFAVFNVFNMLTWDFIIFLSNSRDFVLILFNHMAHDRLGTQINVSIIQSFSIHSCQALVNWSIFGLNLYRIENKVLSPKQMLWRCWSGRSFLWLEHLITIMQELYFLSLI